MSDSGAGPRVELRDEFTVVGTEIRTTDETESDPTTAQIGAHWQRFYESALADRIPDRTDAAVLYGVYTDYESDYREAYSHLIACEVSNGGKALPAMTTLTIPAAKYLVFAGNGNGELPGVVIQTWGAVWQYFEREARDKRAYTVDFERHDQREPSRVEIYIAVKSL
jgi:predicted transcriptional regulator YdeE